jgi:hypothetical protein
MNRNSEINAAPTKKMKKHVRFAPSVKGGEENETVDETRVAPRVWPSHFISDVDGRVYSSSVLHRHRCHADTKKIKMMLSPPRRPQRRRSLEVIEIVDSYNIERDSGATVDDVVDDNHDVEDVDGIQQHIQTSHQSELSSPTSAPLMNSKRFKSSAESAIEKKIRPAQTLTPTISPTSVEELIFPSSTLHSRPEESSAATPLTPQSDISPHCYRRHLRARRGDSPVMSIPFLDGDDDEEEEAKECIDAAGRNEYCHGCYEDGGRLVHDHDSQSTHDSSITGGRTLHQLLADWTRTIEHEHDRLTSSCSDKSRIDTCSPSMLVQKKDEKVITNTNNGGLHKIIKSNDRTNKAIDDKDDVSLDDLELLEESFFELQASDDNLGALLDSIDLALGRLRVRQD